MTPPTVRLGAGELVATFAEASGEAPALLLLHRPGPGEDTTPRRVDLSESPEEERQRDWQECLSRGLLVIAAHPVSGFDLLLETVRECAERTLGLARGVPVAETDADPHVHLERLARRCFHIRAVLGLEGAATPDDILRAAEFVWTKQKELLKREREARGLEAARHDEALAKWQSEINRRARLQEDAEERGARWALAEAADRLEGDNAAQRALAAISPSDACAAQRKHKAQADLVAEQDVFEEIARAHYDFIAAENPGMSLPPWRTLTDDQKYRSRAVASTILARVPALRGRP